MTILTRQQVIEQLTPAASDEDQARAAAEQLAAWAFDQFYAQEAGALAFEPGYRRVIGAVLDDLMFSDQPGFHLAAPDVQQMITHLQQAGPADDDEEDDDERDLDD